jgi:hypothetical protein
MIFWGICGERRGWHDHCYEDAGSSDIASHGRPVVTTKEPDMKPAVQLLGASAALSVLLALHGALARGPSGSDDAAPNVPAALAVPTAFEVAAAFSATGVQIYRCQASATVAGEFAWTFVAPEATLFDRSGKVAGHHYAGPTWEANDGSKVVGSVAARAPSPDGVSIAWLLLTATVVTPGETFEHVAYVQRLNTKGGAAPASGCAADSTNVEIRIPYSAEYYFYATR